MVGHNTVGHNTVIVYYLVVLSQEAHLTVELILLMILTVNLLLKIVWLGFKQFIRCRGVFIVSQSMSGIKFITLCYHTCYYYRVQGIIIIIMVIEVLVIIGRGERHMRFTRALRPFILLDTFLMSGVRRYYPIYNNNNHHQSTVVEFYVKCFSASSIQQMSCWFYSSLLLFFP